MAFDRGESVSNEFHGMPQTGISIEQMLNPVLGHHSLAVSKLLLGPQDNFRKNDVWNTLEDMCEGLTMTGSVVQETYPRPTEANRVLSAKLGGLIRAVKLGFFGGDIDVRKLDPDQYLGIKLGTYLLPPNIDIRFSRTEWDLASQEKVIDLLLKNGRALANDGWFASRIEIPGVVTQLHFGHSDVVCSGVNFYFKIKDESVGDSRKTSEYETRSNVREWERQVDLGVNDNGNLVGRSPGLLNMKNTIRNQLRFMSEGERQAELARAIREVAMTGRVPSQLDLRSYMGVDNLPATWSLKHWFTCMGNLALSMVQDPVETKVLLQDIGGMNAEIDRLPGTTTGVLEFLSRHRETTYMHPEWTVMLAKCDRLLEPHAGYKTMDQLSMVALTPLITMLNPLAYKELVDLVPVPENRELVTKLS